MNINKMRDSVLAGNVATIEAQIIDDITYQERTNVNQADAIAAKEDHIARLKAQYTTILVPTP